VGEIDVRALARQVSEERAGMAGNSWRDTASCFRRGADDLALRKILCPGCAVRMECLANCIVHEERTLRNGRVLRHDVYGGTTPTERDALVKAHPVLRPEFGQGVWYADRRRRGETPDAIALDEDSSRRGVYRRLELVQRFVLEGPGSDEEDPE